MTIASEEAPFGRLLKEWRSQRRMSQLDLGLAADVSTRHISFLETGRSKPSRTMVMHLSETLSIPRTERNSLLSAAGFSAGYVERDLEGEDMEAVRSAIDWMLERHDPYPAMALDRHWTVVEANDTGRLFLGVSNIGIGDCLLEPMSDVEVLKQMFANWEEVGRYFLARLRTEATHLGGDWKLEVAAKRLQETRPVAFEVDQRPLPAVIPARYRFGDKVLSFFSTISHFGTVEDIILADMKLEFMFAADEETKTFFADRQN